MKFTSIMNLAAAFAVSSANAMALNARSAQDDFVPKILTPTARTVWIVGTTVSVTWETADAPKQITNPIGQIQLAQNGMSTPVVLDEGFSILTGSASFVVPNVRNGTYAIQLFGDPGYFSPDFTITGSNSLF